MAGPPATDSPTPAGPDASQATRPAELQEARFPSLTCAVLAALAAVFVLELILDVGPPAGFLSPGVRTLRALGALSSAAVFAAGEWWRVLTSVFLHAGPMHLLLNGVALFAAGYVLETFIGRAWFAALFVTGGICGSLMSLAVNPRNLVSVGASGAIMALFSALLVGSLHVPRGQRAQALILSLRVLVPSLLPSGTAEGGLQVDYAAHFGGALGGAFVGLLMLAVWPKTRVFPRFGGFVAGTVACGALIAFAAATPPLVRHQRSNIEALYARGVADDDKGEYDRAIEEFSEAIRLDPNDVDLYYDRGIAYRRRGDYDHAIADYSEVLRTDPDNAPAYFARGIAYRYKGELDRAIDDETQAIRIDSRKPDFFYQRAIAYRLEGRYDNAVEDLSQAIRLNGKAPDFFNERGIVHDDKGEYDLAIQDYSQALRLKPDYAAAFYNRGLAYGKKGDYDRAIADYGEAIRLDPQDAKAFNNRGVAHAHKGDYDRAIADYGEAIRLDPKDELARNNLRQAREALVRREKSGG